MNQTTIEFLKEHLEYVFIFAGLLILVGAICNRKQLAMPTQEDRTRDPRGFSQTSLDSKCLTCSPVFAVSCSSSLASSIYDITTKASSSKKVHRFSSKVRRLLKNDGLFLLNLPHFGKYLPRNFENVGNVSRQNEEIQCFFLRVQVHRCISYQYIFSSYSHNPEAIWGLSAIFAVQFRNETLE